MDDTILIANLIDVTLVDDVMFTYHLYIYNRHERMKWIRICVMRRHTIISLAPSQNHNFTSRFGTGHKHIAGQLILC
jgi:hypothetical protein